MTDKMQTQGLSHEEIEVTLQNYLKNGGKIQRLEMERASTDLNVVLEREWQEYSSPAPTIWSINELTVKCVAHTHPRGRPQNIGIID